MRTTLALVALLLAGCRSTESEPAPAPNTAQVARSTPEDLQVIALKHAGANDLAREIRAVFSAGAAGGGARKPTVVADERTNSLIVRASAEDMAAIQALVAQLDARLAGAGS